MPSKDFVRLALLGDLHYSRTTPTGSLQPLLSQINDDRRAGADRRTPIEVH